MKTLQPAGIKILTTMTDVGCELHQQNKPCEYCGKENNMKKLPTVDDAVEAEFQKGKELGLARQESEETPHSITDEDGYGFWYSTFYS